jgi:hypothetical protein
MQLLYFLIQPDILLGQSLLIAAILLLLTSCFACGVLLLLLVGKLVVHVALLYLGATLHKTLHDLVDFLFAAHLLNLGLALFSDWKTAEIEIGVFLHQGLGVALSFEGCQYVFLFLQYLLIIVGVVLLFLDPVIHHFLILQIFQLLLLLNEIIRRIEPGVELVETRLCFITSTHVRVPCLHVTQTVLKLLLCPDELDLLCVFLLTEDY